MHDSSWSDALLEAALDAIVAMDHEGRIVEFNPAAVRIFAYTREEAIGQRLGDLIVPPELREQHEAGFARYLRTQEPTVVGTRVKLPALRSDGTRFPAEIAITRVETDGPPLFLGFIRDISDAVLAEERYQSLVERLPLVVYLNACTEQPATEYISPQIEELLGYPVASWLGEDNSFYASILHPDDRDWVETESRRARRAAEPFRAEYRLRHRDGHWIWVLDETTLLRDPQGKPCGYQGFLLNITDTKQLEERLRHGQKMDAVGQLAGGIAHDFNNMLTAISGYAELLELSFEPGDSRLDDVGELKRAAAHAAALTRQLLAFSRKQVLQPQLLDANGIVRGLEAMLGRTIGEQIELVTELERGLAPVEADPDQVAQVVLNIALNARDAMPDGGRLTIETANVELDSLAHVAITIADDGRGMDEATRLRVFEPFFTTKETGKGTGLGLATAYGVVSQSGGRIEVASEPGKGSTFVVLLPCAGVESRVAA